MIDSKKNFGINIVDKDFVPDKNFLARKDDGTIGPATVEDMGGGVVMGKKMNDELGKMTIEINLQKQEKTSSAKRLNGQAIADPNYVVHFHEYGHGYYRYVMNRADQGCKAIDAENDVRRNTNLPLRQFDPLRPNGKPNIHSEQ